MNLKNRTPKQRAKDLRYFESLSMKELRRRQDLISQQKQRGFNLYMTAKERGDVLGMQKAEQVADNLEEMFQDITSAVDTKAFGKPKKKRRN